MWASPAAAVLACVLLFVSVWLLLLLLLAGRERFTSSVTSPAVNEEGERLLRLSCAPEGLDGEGHTFSALSGVARVSPGDSRCVLLGTGGGLLPSPEGCEGGPDAFRRRSRRVGLHGGVPRCVVDVAGMTGAQLRDFDRHLTDAALEASPRVAKARAEMGRLASERRSEREAHQAQMAGIRVELRKLSEERRALEGAISGHEGREALQVRRRVAAERGR